MWILSCAQPTNTCSKLTIKKFRLICICSSLKINAACYRSFVFIVDFDHIFYCFSYFNLEQVFVNRLWKTSHNVLKTLFQGLFHSAVYHWTQLKQIATTLSAYYDMNILWAYVSALNFLWESQANDHRFVLLFDLLYHRYFPEILSFLLCQNENLFKSWFKPCFNALKQWKKLVGVWSATLIIGFMT